MGESFKLHAQALTGYEDAIAGEAEVEVEQKMASPLEPEGMVVAHAQEVTAF